MKTKRVAQKFGCPFCCSKFFPSKIEFAIEIAFDPESRITPIAPEPEGVDKAQMVSEV